MMWFLRFVITFYFELFNSFSGRKGIKSLGYKDGSFGAWISWCYTVASFCATYKHPLKYCWNRSEWEKWMSE